MKHLLFLLTLSFLSLNIFAQTKTWVGGTTSSFDEPNNWNPTGKPLPINDVIIPSGSHVNSVTNINIKSLTIQGDAIFDLSKDLTFSETSSIAADAIVNWTNGIISGDSLINNGTFNLTSSATKHIYGNTEFINNGTFNIDSDGYFMLTNTSPTFTNATSGVLNLNAEGQITYALGSGKGLIVNKGLIQKQQNNGKLTILTDLQNLGGTISVEAGTLTLNSFDNLFNDGTINIDAGKTLEWEGTITLEGDLVGQIDGLLDWKGDIVVHNDKNVNLDFSGPSGVSWSNGIFLGDGTMTNKGIFNLDGSSSKAIHGLSTFINESVFNINSDAYFELTNFEPTFDNTSTGIININDGGQITFSLGSGSGLLINSGLINKQESNADFHILADFHNNDGTISVTNGSLILNTENAVLTNGLYNVTTGNLLEWKKNLKLEGTLNGEVEGQINWNGNINIPLNTEATLNFIDSAGFNWTGGALIGDGTLTNTGIINLEGTGSRNIKTQSILKNKGLINYDISGYLILEGTSVLDNTTLGTINLNTTGQFTFSSGKGTLINSGLVKKKLSVDPFVMLTYIKNLSTGVFESESGLLEFINYEGNGTLTGIGAIKIPDTTNFEGTISPGGAPGTLTLVGNYKASEDAILSYQIYGTTPDTEYDVLDILGNAHLDGNISIVLNFPAQIGDEFVILNANNITTCNLPETVNAIYGLEYYTFDVKCNQDNVTLKVMDIAVDIQEKSLDQLTLYPNPNNGIFTIDLGKEYKEVTVQIYDLLGKMVTSEHFTSVLSIPQAIHGNSGLYFVKIQIDQNDYKTFKISKY